jgi:hypothetical protein
MNIDIETLMEIKDLLKDNLVRDPRALPLLQKVCDIIAQDIEMRRWSV